ncbi:uncharacterized protein [Nicotiana tomentosiformis]|uniref:uncharacterized protein n=1 Tax=Nicotiana tomentosiformis TaxID=4098 RepID=UPI00388CA930
MAEYEACILGLNLTVDMNIQELLVIGDSDLLVHQVQGEWATKNTKIIPYMHHVQEMMKRFTKIEFLHVPKIQNEFADALVTLSSMIQHPDKNFIDPILVRIHNRTAYCAHVEEETDGNPWFHDIREYLAKGEYPEHANHTQKCTLRRLSNHFFQSGGILYRRTPDLGLLRCVDAKEASKLLEEIHAGTCSPHMNGFVLAKKILRAGYFWMTMETDCIRTEVVIPGEVEIPSLRIIQEAELSDVEWIRSRYEQLALIDGKIMNADKAKGKFSPNWQGPYVVHRVLTGGALILAEMDGEIWPKPINSDTVKRYYV